MEQCQFRDYILRQHDRSVERGGGGVLGANCPSPLGHTGSSGTNSYPLNWQLPLHAQSSFRLWMFALGSPPAPTQIMGFAAGTKVRLRFSVLIVR